MSGSRNSSDSNNHVIQYIPGEKEEEAQLFLLAEQFHNTHQKVLREIAEKNKQSAASASVTAEVTNPDLKKQERSSTPDDFDNGSTTEEDMDEQTTNVVPMLNRYRVAGILSAEEKLDLITDPDKLGKLTERRLKSMEYRLSIFNLSGLSNEDRQQHFRMLESVRKILRQNAHSYPDMNIPELNAYIAKHRVFLSQALTAGNMEEWALHRQYIAEAVAALEILQEMEEKADANIMTESKKIEEDRQQREQKEIDDAMRQFAALDAPRNEDIFRKLTELQSEATTLIFTLENNAAEKAADKLAKLSEAAIQIIDGVITGKLTLTKEEQDHFIFGELQQFIKNLQQFIKNLEPVLTRQLSDKEAKAEKNKTAQKMANLKSVYEKPKGDETGKHGGLYRGGIYSSSFHILKPKKNGLGDQELVENFKIGKSSSSYRR